MSRTLNPVSPEKSYAFSLANFARFLPAIKQVIDTFPHTITFTPQGLSASSWALYFRSACQAFIHDDCHWLAPFSKDQVKTLWINNLHIDYDKAKQSVTISSRNHASTKTDSTAFALPKGCFHVENDQPLLHALLLLKNRELIKDELYFTGIPPSEYESLCEAFPNLSLSLNGNGLLSCF